MQGVAQGWGTAARVVEGRVEGVGVGRGGVGGRATHRALCCCRPAERGSPPQTLQGGGGVQTPAAEADRVGRRTQGRRRQGAHQPSPVQPTPAAPANSAAGLRGASCAYGPTFSTSQLPATLQPAPTGAQSPLSVFTCKLHVRQSKPAGLGGGSRQRCGGHAPPMMHTQARMHRQGTPSLGRSRCSAPLQQPLPWHRHRHRHACTRCGAPPGHRLHLCYLVVVQWLLPVAARAFQPTARNQHLHMQPRFGHQHIRRQYPRPQCIQPCCGHCLLTCSPDASPS